MRPKAFNDLPSLEKLDLSSSGITEIKKGVFVNLPKLKVLNLQLNHSLRTLHPGAFNDLPSLEKLDLSENNGITEIKAGTFVNLPKLKKLMLHSNTKDLIPYLRENTLCPGAFDDLPSLENLDLSCHRLTKIKPGTFVKLPKLKYINLANNRIKNLYPEAF